MHGDSLEPRRSGCGLGGSDQTEWRRSRKRFLRQRRRTQWRTRDDRGSQNDLESELTGFHFVQYLVDHFGQSDSHWATAG
jgi:hypothetical protein